MIIFPILMAFFSGLLILWIFDQHKYLNIFEQISFGFGIAISLFVFELFLGGVILNTLSIIFPFITFLILLGVFIFKCIKKSLFSDIILSVKDTLISIKSEFHKFKLWQKLLCIFIIFYVFAKIFMAFSINVNMPTYDEDAVNGWDLKTKILFENRNLILDKNNIEFLGSSLDRIIFAPITDFYFISIYEKFPVGLSNIISPLIYFCLILFFFGILLRKCNLFCSFISIYIFTSLPFVFIHSFASYFNHISGFFLFTFAFYLSDQIFSLEDRHEINKGIIIPLGIFAFLDASIRNESLLLMLAIFGVECILYYIKNKNKFNVTKIFSVLYIFIGIIASYLSTSYLNYLSPKKLADVSGTFLGGIISKFFENIGKPGVFSAPFEQSFYHTDYNLLYLLFFISLILFIFNGSQMRNIKSILFSTFLLLSIFIFILYVHVEGLGLLTHFSFVRYPIAIIPFLVYLVSYFYFLFWNSKCIE